MINGNYVAAIEAYRQSSLRSAATWNKIGIAYHHLFALEEARKNYQRRLLSIRDTLTRSTTSLPSTTESANIRRRKKPIRGR